MSKVYVTTPIYYVNDLPHIGHIYTTLVTDTVARYHRSRGDDVYFLTGTDEHGQKIEQAAEAAGLTPIRLADRVVERYRVLWPKLSVTPDDFIRTTEPRHYEGVKAIVERIAASGDLYVDRHEGWYCTGCEAFYTEKELLEGGRCPIHEREVEEQAEENVFFRLSKYEEDLLRWYDESPESVLPETRRNEMRSFVAQGLRDLSVSRTSLEWGLDFPGYQGHTIYVWLDALTNYVSALGFGQEDDRLYREFWADPDSTRLHLIGKDILRFHAIYWPAFLMSAGLPLPTTVHAHGWWLRDERKVSKSGGNIVRPDHLVDRFGADSLRYYLLREMAFGQDASFSDEGFVERYNADLANGLGNTLSRLTTLSRRTFDGATPPRPAEIGPLPEIARESVGRYEEKMEERSFHLALESLWRLVNETNQYLVTHEPWKLRKEPGSEARVGEILWNGLEAVRIVATALHPVLPEKAPGVLRALGLEPEDLGPEDLEWGGLPGGRALPETESLFPRIDKEEYLAEIVGGEDPEDPAHVEQEPLEQKAEEETMADEPKIDMQTFMNVDLRVATVKAADEIPGADKLLALTVELPGEERTMVAGIKEYYEPEDLVGKQVVVVANLEPATLMGVESQGMVLAATVDGRPYLIHPDDEVPVGSRVR
ncbi:MAG: methionine--tRNA ligase [Thermoanaerobaculia bacterium]|nr:methionine--tRNA ligase [Thermoanaerobaculia bacterium]